MLIDLIWFGLDLIWIGFILIWIVSMSIHDDDDDDDEIINRKSIRMIDRTTSGKVIYLRIVPFEGNINTTFPWLHQVSMANQAKIL